MGGQLNYLAIATTSTNEAYRSTEIASHIQYLGWADPGTATSVTKWKICLVTYDATDTVVLSITWPGGSRNYSWAWDERVTYATDPTYT